MRTETKKILLVAGKAAKFPDADNKEAQYGNTPQCIQGKIPGMIIMLKLRGSTLNWRRSSAHGSWFW